MSEELDTSTDISPSDDGSELNVHIDLTPKNDKSETLVCNWCAEPHAVDADYKEAMLERGEEQLMVLRQQYPDKAEVHELEPDQTWTCGRCLLFLCGHSPDSMRTDCHDHAVPEERQT